MQSFTFNTTTQLHVENGAAGRLAALDPVRFAGPVLFITDPGLRKLGLCDPALASLRAAGRPVTVFDAVEADPSRATLMQAVEAGREAGIRSVIGFGGGSSMDVAKLVALILGSGEDIDDAWGVGNARGPRLPLMLVPTTAGTGSEVTPVSIITLEGSEKRGVSSALLIPDLAVLDADLTLGLPTTVTAATGIDAMVHAIEAYTSRNANNNPISRLLAREALRLLGSNIETVIRDGSHRDARQAMLIGSMLAGQAFANSPVAAVHALAYPIGGIFHVPHGLSNALVLPHVLRFNLPEAEAGYAEIAADIFPALADLRNPRERAEGLIVGLSDLSRRIGLPQRLRDVGIDEADLPHMANEAMKQQRLLVNNPRPLGESDALAIYTAAW